jgi:O-antigen/teichoic acid export membrane protein
VKSFAWYVLFPMVPLALAIGACIGCAKADVPIVWAWLVGGVTLLAYIAATWYGQKRGREEL